MPTPRLDLLIRGMTCASGVARIEKGLHDLPGVTEVSANLAGERATLTYDPEQVGTVTQGEPEVTDLVPVNGGTAHDLLRFAASAEQGSEHPLGEAMGKRAQLGSIMIKRKRRQLLQWLTMGIGVVAAGSALKWVTSTSAGSSIRKTPNGDLLETVPQGSLPSFAQQKGPKVQEAYRYAVDHADTLQYIPCFCGCKNIGHRHNADCYVAERLLDGQVTFTSHGAT